MARWRTMLALVGTAVVVVGTASLLLRGRSFEVLYARWVLHNAPTALVGLWLGWLLLRTRPGHGLGRLLLLMGVLGAAHVGTISLADARLVAAGAGEAAILEIVPAQLPLDATLPLWFSSWLWVPAAVLFSTLMLALFPDGRLPGPRWRWVGLSTFVGSTTLGFAYAIVHWPTSTSPMTLNEQPMQTPVAGTLVIVGSLSVLAAVAGTIGTLVVRWRTAAGEQRQQLRAVIVAGGATALTLTVLWPWQAVWIPASLIAMLAFIVTYVVAIARYRLHDLDVVLNRAVVATVLAALVTLGYLLIVVGVGGIVGRGSERPLLPLIATGVVAVLFEPARRRVGFLVDRLLYGRDGDAYEVLSDLASRLRDAPSEEDLLTQVAGLLARGTGARRAEVVVATGTRAHTVAASGAPATGPPLLAMPVTHNGQTLGELRLHGRSPADLAPDAARLLDDMAATLGVLLANLLLRHELQEQVDELRRSRQRLVRVHDEARRELERDLHDGAQARLVALRIRLGMAAELLQRPDGADDAPADAGLELGTELRALADEVDEALRGLRDLSRGLHPPALEGAGIVEALRTAVQGMPIDVTIEGPRTGRYHRSVETAVYFACLEAIQNAVKHGARRRVEVRLGADDGLLRFTVEDDGPGWEPQDVPAGRGLANLSDRVAALDGRVEVDAAAGRGTLVQGWIPVEPLVVEAS